MALLFLALLCGLSLWTNWQAVETTGSTGLITPYRKGKHVMIENTTLNNASAIILPNAPNYKFPSLASSSSDGMKYHSIWRYPLPSVSSSSDNKNTRAIALLSMGPDAADSTLVERCVISIRKRGRFFGPILLITDAPVDRYNNSLASQDWNLVVLQPLVSDWKWELKRDMPYKRFKTYLLTFFTRDPRLHSVQSVFYLDIDIVVGQPLLPWFEYVEQRYFLPNSHQTTNDVSSSVMILFEGNSSPLQSGQFFMKRGHSEGCLERWRYHIDTHPKVHKDQASLTLMWEEQQQQQPQRGIAGNCTLIRMQQEPYLQFLSTKEMSRLQNGGGGGGDAAASSSFNYPTLMHIKNTQHANMIPDKLQKTFFQRLLDLPPELVVNIMGRRRIRPNRTWSALQVQKGHQ